MVIFKKKNDAIKKAVSTLAKHNERGKGENGKRGKGGKGEKGGREKENIRKIGKRAAHTLHSDQCLLYYEALYLRMDIDIE